MLDSDDRLGRYRIIELIGSGGMGEVYAAEDTELQRSVAIKLFARELPAGSARDHLLHEARAASALSHPNVCTVFEVGEDNGRRYIVMEYVKGRTLDALIAGRALATERVVRYGAQIADAIAHAHEKGVIHRDMKSANVVITDEGRAKVLDFGLASTVSMGSDVATREVTSAEAGRLSGTLSYMAPEVLRGQPADARSDVWALGVVLYESLVGRLPFRGDTAFEVSTAIMKDSAEIPVEASAGLETVIHRCLQKAPGERYQSAAEVRAALEMLQSGGSKSNEMVGAGFGAGSTTGTNWTAIAAGFSVVAVLALAAWMVLGGGASGEDGRGGDAAPAASGVAIGASGRPTVAVLPFRDRTQAADSAWMAEGIPSMLVTGLAQSPGLDVVGNSRVQDIVSRLGVENLHDNDADVLSEFGVRSGAGAIVIGDLYFTGTDYRIDAQVEDVRSGRVLSAYTVTGPFVFGLVDELVEQIRRSLEVGADIAVAPLANVTTASLDAWRAYDEGLRLRYHVRPPQALAKFEEAIAIDPEFALAKFQAARLSAYMDDPDTADGYDDFVKANLERLPGRDRPYVEAIYRIEANELEGARQLLEELLATYPDHELAWLALSNSLAEGFGFSVAQLTALERGVAAMPASGVLHNQLGYAYADAGRYTEAIRTIERYVELNPEEANAYDSLAEMYTISGQPQLGFENYTRTMEVDPGWVGAPYGRAMTLGMMGRYGEALDELDRFRELWDAERPTVTSAEPHIRSVMLSKLGRYDEAAERIGAGIARAQARNDAPMAGTLQMIGTMVALESGDFDAVRDFAPGLLRQTETIPDPGLSALNAAAIAHSGLADLHDGDQAAATAALAELRRLAAEESSPFYPGARNMLAGEIALAAGDLDAAERSFDALLPEIKAFYSISNTPGTLMANDHPLRDDVARVLVARGDIQGAIDAYRGLLTVNLGSRYNAFVDPRYILKLAELLDRAGQASEARAEYLRFADYWAEADPQFQPMVERARARAAELGD